MSGLFCSILQQLKEFSILTYHALDKRVSTAMHIYLISEVMNG